MAEEFSGYVSNRGGTVDWGAAATGLSSAVKSVDEARKSRQAENERIYRESEKMMAATEQPKSKTLSDFTLKGADTGRAKRVEWYRKLKNGDMSASDYKRNIANLDDSWANLATTVKTLDQRMAQALARQQVGEDGTMPPASAIEAEMQAYFGALSQLGDKQIVVGDDGRVAVGRFDQNGNMLSSEDVKYINNPANIEFNRADLDGMVAAGVKNWATWQKGRVTDPRLNPKFSLEKVRLINTITSNPRSAASVLVDNTDGEYLVFFNEEDKRAKMDAIKSEMQQAGMSVSDADVEAKMIRMYQDANGDYQPMLTESQIKKARELVDNSIEMQLERQVEPAPYYGGGGGSRGGGSDDNVAINAYMSSVDAIKNGDFSGFDTDNYTFKRSVDNGGKPYVLVSKLVKDERTGGMAPSKSQTVRVYSPDGMTQYLRNIKGNVPMYHKGKDDYLKLNGTYYYNENQQQQANSGSPKVSDLRSKYNY